MAKFGSRSVFGVFLSVLLLLLSIASSAKAQIHSQMGAFATGYARQIYVQSGQAEHSDAFNLDWVFFLDRSLAFNVHWNLNVDTYRFNRHYVSLGLKQYIGRHKEFIPYGLLNFSYLYRPEQELGWEAKLGVEWNAYKLTKIDNLRLDASVGFDHWIVAGGPDIYKFDLLQLSFAWHF